MRRIIADIGITADGFIEDAYGNLDWFSVSNRIGHLIPLLETFDTLLCGQATYEKLCIPRPVDGDIPEPERSFNATLNWMRKYVVSSGVRHVRGNAMVIYQDLEREVRRIRDEEGKDIWFCGGAQTLHKLAALDLIDEYRLTVYPILLGTGKSFFETITGRQQPTPPNSRLFRVRNFRLTPDRRTDHSITRWP